MEERTQRIISCLERAALEVGAELLAAKQEHPREFVAWVEGTLPFGIDKAERLMAITRCFADADPEIRAALPPAWSALYELTRLPSERLLPAIEAGAVHPDMTVAQAKALRSKGFRVPEQPRLTADIVARELVRFDRRDLSDEVRAALEDWIAGKAWS